MAIKLFRNLSYCEIYDQVFLINEFALKSLKNHSPILFISEWRAVFNSINKLNSINHITSKKGLNISAKRITVSTIAGIANYKTYS